MTCYSSWSPGNLGFVWLFSLAVTRYDGPDQQDRHCPAPRRCEIKSLGLLFPTSFQVEYPSVPRYLISLGK